MFALLRHVWGWFVCGMIVFVPKKTTKDMLPGLFQFDSKGSTSAHENAQNQEMHVQRAPRHLLAKQMVRNWTFLKESVISRIPRLGSNC